jgi:hypothetical protein
LVVLLALLFFPQIAFSSPTASAVIIAAPNCTYSRYLACAAPDAVAFRKRAAAGLMSVGMPRKADPFGDLYASLNAGDTANTGNPNRDLLTHIIASSNRPGSIKIVTVSNLDDAFHLADAFSQNRSHWVILCGFPPYNRHRNRWENLGLAAISGPGENYGALTSPTTQTIGLIALRDIAPTALSAVGLPAPESMTGARIVALDRNPRDILPEMDRITSLNEKIQIPGMWAYGIIGAVSLFFTVLAIGRKSRFKPDKREREKRYRSFLCSLIRMILSAPLAFLIAPIFSPGTPVEYGIDILACAVAFGFLLDTGKVCAIIVCVVLIDGMTGSHLASRSVLSEYWVSGIRFYGIGAEYMGTLIGAALLAPYFLLKRIETLQKKPDDNASLAEDRSAQKRGSALPPLWFSILLAAWQFWALFVLVFPAFGAKAGGALTALSGFIPSWLWLTNRKKPTVKIFAIAVIAGFALIFGFGMLANELGARPTHIQKAVGHFLGGQWNVIGPIVLRKIKMAISTVLAPGSIAACLGVALIWIIGGKTNLKKRVSDHLAQNSLLSGLFQCALCALAASLLFNDSGFVSFVLIASFFVGGLLEEILQTDTETA